MREETMEQYIARRTSDDGNQHWNLSPRDLEAMRYMLAERNRLISQELPELPCCPVHESLLKSGKSKPFDNCIVCIRNERDDLLEQIDKQARKHWIELHRTECS